MIGVLSIAFFGYAGWYEQLFGVTVVGIYTIVITTVIVLVAKSIVPIRVSGDEEESGLDLSEHGEKAYSAE